MIRLDIRNQSQTKNLTPTPSVVRNPTLTPPKNLWILTTPQHQLRRLQIFQFFRKNAMTCTPVTGSRQQHTPATLLKPFMRDPVICFCKAENRSVVAFGILSIFFKNLLESENLVCRLWPRRKPFWVSSTCFFAATFWSLKDFGHLSHGRIKTHHNSIYFQALWMKSSNWLNFFRSFKKYFSLWPKYESSPNLRFNYLKAPFFKALCIHIFLEG